MSVTYEWLNTLLWVAKQVNPRDSQTKLTSHAEKISKMGR
jgi:hypothetical protein